MSPLKLVTTRAQSIIEYTLIAMLVILGVIVMGPYVIRSVNAHFKLWDEAVQDALNDRQVTVNFKLTGECRCGPPVAGACGGTGWAIHCAPDERLYASQCTPPTCGFGTPSYTEYCGKTAADQAFCCGQYRSCSSDFGNGDPQTTGCCGNAGTRTSGSADAQGLLPANPAASPAIGGASVDPQSYCYNGEEMWYNQCGAKPPAGIAAVKCKVEPQCSPRCIGTLDPNTGAPPHASWCPDSPHDAASGLKQSTFIIYANGCAHFTSSGIFTVPEWTGELTVRVWGGGGGGGGGGSGSGSYDGGGGGGGALTVANVTLSPGSSYTASVGAGGPGGAGGGGHGSKGSDGGDSSLTGNGVNISSVGGKAGDTAHIGNDNGGNGGTCSGGFCTCTGASCVYYDGGKGGSAQGVTPAGCGGGGAGGGGKAGSGYNEGSGCTSAHNGQEGLSFQGAGAGGSGDNLSGQPGFLPGGGGAGAGSGRSASKGGDGLVSICGPGICTPRFLCEAHCNAGYTAQTDTRTQQTTCVPVRRSVPLSCDITAQNSPSGVHVKSLTTISDADKTHLSCDSGEYLAGFCVRDTSSNKKYGGIRERTETYVDLYEGEDPHNDDENVSADIYCLPCPCPTGCAFPDSGNGFNVGSYYGQPDTDVKCK